jgi:chorismate mutase
MSDELRALRGEIDAVDRRILAAVNERLALVARLWGVKEERGVGRLDPGREQAILDALRETNAGPLSDEGLQELVEDLLTLTKRERERAEREG